MKWWVRESSNTTATYFCWAKWKWQKYSSRSHQQRTVVFIEDLTGKATLSDAINFYTENLESMVKQKTKEIQSTGNIPRSFTIRHLSEAIDTASSLKGIKKKMVELVNNIVSIDSDGKFNKEQRNIVSSLIKKTI
jgi:hypothetical protein